MKIDCLVAEIGSTTTVINAFDKLNTNSPVFIGQGFSKTTINDVTIGLNNAIKDLQKNLNRVDIDATNIFASSSSAGGLKMTVHGLVYDMTVKAAKEAALGAGANIKMITSGKITKFDLEKLVKIQPNIIMLAGGVDYGETATAIYNANEIAALQLNIPVIYAGNIVAQDSIKEIFGNHNQKEFLFITANVYPKIDTLDVNEARNIIQDVFERHITKSIGMEKVREIVNGKIIPTPGAVMEATILMSKYLGNVITVDIGGATTDIHSVCEDSLEASKVMLNPEPSIKRTVEGDLGVYINKDNIIDMIGKDKLLKELNISLIEYDNLLSSYKPIPEDDQIGFVERLSLEALNKAIERHAGKYTIIYGASGKKKVAEGKDLTEASYLIATGGPLTKLPNRVKIIQDMLNIKDDLRLKPRPSTTILIDNNYIMASLGVLAKSYPEAAYLLLKQSLKLGD